MGNALLTTVELATLPSPRPALNRIKVQHKHCSSLCLPQQTLFLRFSGQLRYSVGSRALAAAGRFQGIEILWLILVHQQTKIPNPLQEITSDFRDPIFTLSSSPQVARVEFQF